MKLRGSYFGFLFLLLHSAHSADVCDSPFRQFLQCMAKDADARIDNYKNEITPTAQAKVQQCFTQAGCQPPDFSKAQVGFFVQEPWTSRINTFLSLLETMDPKVQHCMTDYLKNIVAGKINDCVRKHGTKDIKDFQMPPIPGGYNVDMTKMKTVFLDRMMVRYALSQCAAAAGGQGSVVSCIGIARQDINDGGMCKSRESCLQDNIKDSKCQERFSKIQKTACDCFQSEQGHQQMEKELKNTILSGAVEKKFKECHDQNGVPYPKAKVDAAKQAAKSGFLEVLQNQGHVPPGVQGALNVGKQVMGEMSEQWKGAFCVDCTGGNNDVNSETLRQTASAIQPQLAPSPLATQFQGGGFNQVPVQQQQFAPANFAPFGGAAVPSGMGANSFVAPPPLPPQAPQATSFGAFPQQQQQPAFQSPPIMPQQQPQQQQQSSAMSFEDFKRGLASAFGPVG